MHRMTARGLVAALAVGLTLFGAPGGRATPLDAEACDGLKRELAELGKTGAKDNLAKGPAWAKANLAPERLDQVRRLIEVEEQILFRCSQLRPAKAGATAEHAGAAAGEPTAKPKVKKKATVAAPKDTAQPQSTAKDGTATVVIKPAPKPKAGEAGAAAPSKPAPKTVQPKPSDAYTPPPKATAIPAPAPSQQ